MLRSVPHLQTSLSEVTIILTNPCQCPGGKQDSLWRASLDDMRAPFQSCGSWDFVDLQGLLELGEWMGRWSQGSQL